MRRRVPTPVLGTSEGQTRTHTWPSLYTGSSASLSKFVDSSTCTPVLPGPLTPSDPHSRLDGRLDVFGDLNERLSS